MSAPICRLPFEFAEVNVDGDIYFCCPLWARGNCIGSITKTSFDKVWNSDTARAIRKSVLDGSYKFCDRGICKFCPADSGEDYAARTMDGHYSKSPKEIKFNHCAECNLACGCCRKSLYFTPGDDLARLNSEIDSVYLPLLDGVERVCFAGFGDPFASRHYRELIKRAAEKYPDLKFLFHTNGVGASRQMLKDLGVEDRLYGIQVSIHSATRETWQNFTRGRPEQYDALMENIKYLSELKERGLLPTLQINFVITNFNYRELVPFIRLAKSFSSDRIEIWGYRNWSLQTPTEEAGLSVFRPGHHEYDKLREILRDPVFAKPEVHLYPEIKKIRDEALQEAGA